MRGIVLEINSGRCVVMMRNHTFREVKDFGYSVGEEINLKSPIRYSGYIAAAACMLLVCTLSFGGIKLYNTPTSYVYMDINPSVRLDVNCFDKVIDVVALNEDAKEVLELYPVMKKVSTEKCINSIVALCREQSYINDENKDIEINLLSTNKKLGNVVQNATQELEREELSISVYSMSEQQNQTAINHGISAKRLRAVEAYTQLVGGEMEENFEKLQEVEEDDIYKQLREYSRLSQAENETDADTQNTESVAESDMLYISQKRIEAIESYTAFFGGDKNENTKLLYGMTIAAIYREIEEAETEINESGEEIETVEETEAAEESTESLKEDTTKPDAGHKPLTEESAVSGGEQKNPEKVLEEDGESIIPDAMEPNVNMEGNQNIMPEKTPDMDEKPKNNQETIPGETGMDERPKENQETIPGEAGVDERPKDNQSEVPGQSQEQDRRPEGIQNEVPGETSGVLERPENKPNKIPEEAPEEVERPEANPNEVLQEVPGTDKRPENVPNGVPGEGSGTLERPENGLNKAPKEEKGVDESVNVKLYDGAFRKKCWMNCGK